MTPVSPDHSRLSPSPRVLFWFCLSAAVLISRLCHVHILWADEDYHLAAAIQVLAGKFPYRDFWYDKPPLNLAFYLLFGARAGLPLRVADSVFVVLCCALAYRFARKLWSDREAYYAAAGLAFFSIFYLVSGVLPEEPDTLMLLPHLAAVYLAFRRRTLLAGIAAGLAFQLSVKGMFVLGSAALFLEAGALPMLAAGFLIPTVAAAAWLAFAGAIGAYVQQVWRWGFLDAASPPTLRGALTILTWTGFHAALFLAACWYWLRKRDRDAVRTLAWSIVSFGATGVGLRFAPRYFMQLLPALAIPAAWGYANAPRLIRWAILATLLVPAIRFGPRYLELARENVLAQPDFWADTAMDRESRRAAGAVLALAKPGDTIFIWGYRPDVVAYTRLPVAGLFWDSQPLTGVPADRHLSDSKASDPAWASRNRLMLVSERPDFLVDGLSLYNPQLDIHRYPELAAWLARYCVAARTGGAIVYRACAHP